MNFRFSLFPNFIFLSKQSHFFCPWIHPKKTYYIFLFAWAIPIIILFLQMIFCDMSVKQEKIALFHQHVLFLPSSEISTLWLDSCRPEAPLHCSLNWKSLQYLDAGHPNLVSISSWFTKLQTNLGKLVSKCKRFLSSFIYSFV